MIKLLLCLLILLLPPQLCRAEAPSALNLGQLKVSELEAIYKFYDYDGPRGYLMVPAYHYPPIYLSSFPADFKDITDEQQRIILFIKILAPLALKLNQEILAERAEIEQIEKSFRQEHDLTAEQSSFIEDKARKYDIFTRLKGYQRNLFLLTELLNRVDALPPSFLIAASAVETDWGASRLVTEGNSLYKHRSWHTDEGLKPRGETDDSYRYTVYPDIAASMRAFALKINSHIAFEHLRNFRRELRFRDSILRGTTFAFTLLWNSPLKNYAGLMEYTIAFYELNIIDKSLLDSKMIDKELPVNLKQFIQKDNLTEEKI